MGIAERVTQRISLLPSFLDGEHGGEFWLSCNRAQDALPWTFHIERADPKVMIPDRLVSELESGPLHPDVEFADGVLRIRGTNRTVIYRLVEHDEMRGCWLAEWPD